MNRGEIRWYIFRPPDKRRPVLVLTRDEVIDTLNEIIVAPVTRTRYQPTHDGALAGAAGTWEA